MSRRYIGHAVTDAPLAGVRGVPLAVAAAATGLLVAQRIDSEALDSLTPKAVVGIWGLHLGVLALFGGWELLKLTALMRAATPADQVATPETTEREPARWESVALPLLFGVLVAGACVLFEGAAVVVLGGMAVGLGSASAVAAGKLLVQRRERRLGRRYFLTSGEPEKIVWIADSPLDPRSEAGSRL